MKKILLLGDSIRMNYQEYVKEELRNEANVYFPKENGKFCAYTLRYLHEWLDELSEGEKVHFDIIHFNNGLWDVLRLSNENETFTTEEEYIRFLTRIVNRIRFFCPNAQLVFATTTEVIEPGSQQGVKYVERRNSDIRRYNEIAKELFARLDVEIDDLWEVSKSMSHEAYSDQVHFETKIGIETLGNQVVRVLRSKI